MTTTAITTAAACDRLDCGHVGRSTSRAVKRAAVLYGCLAGVPGFELPADEPAEVLALVALMQAGTECSAVAAFADLWEWHTAAVIWAAEEEQSWLILPQDTPLYAVLG